MDAKGNLVLPGLIDCHSHLFSLAEKEDEVDLRDCKSISEMQERIAQFLSRKQLGKAEWILGRGWDQDLFEEKRIPSKEDIDKVLPDNPSVMTRICGHIAVVNSKALESLKFLSRQPEELVPRAGESPIGIVKEGALDKIWKAVPSLTRNQLATSMERVLKQALQFGMVAAHCILSSNWKEELAAIRILDKEGKLEIALSFFLPTEAIDEVEKMTKKERDLLNGQSFCVLGFKAFADGSLGARTAALIIPYSDDPNNSGILLYTEEELAAIAKRVKKLRMILATHAIGDRAVEQVLNAYRKACIKEKDNFRIEHCSVVNKRFLRRLSGVILSVQPSFATSDYWIPNRLGSAEERIAYPLKTLNKLALIVGGSDSPVEDLNPLKGICSATQNPLSIERLDLKQAVHIYSSNTANLSPLTRRYGRIAAGFQSNLIVLDTSDREQFCKAKPQQILHKGKWVYEATK